MKAVIALLALGFLTILLPVDLAADAPSLSADVGGVLYLTGIREELLQDPVCAYDLPRYALVTNSSRVEDGRANAALGAAAGGCPTYFTYTARVPFNLTGTAHVSFWVACDQPTAASVLEKFLVLLTTDLVPPGVDSNYKSVGGPLVCTQAPFQVKVDLPTRDLALNAGDSLTLAIASVYANPPPSLAPNLHFVVGGQNASRIEANGIPSTSQQTIPGAGQAPPFLAWTGQPAQSKTHPGESCFDDSGAMEYPRYALNATVPAIGKAYADAGTQAQSCLLLFLYTAEGPFTIRGTAHAHWWFACDHPTIGSDASFILSLYRNGQEIASAGAGGTLGSVGQCTSAPSPLFAELPMNNPTTFEKGDELILSIGAFYNRPPKQALPDLHFAVGGETDDCIGEPISGTPSCIAIEGLPWGKATPEPEPQQGTTTSGQERSTPMPGVLVVAGVAVAAAWAGRTRR